MDGAGGIVGAKYLGEVAPRDGTIAGYFTGTAFMYALDPERFRVDFKTYEFVATQPGTTVHFVRTDVAPGMKEPTDIAKAQGPHRRRLERRHAEGPAPAARHGHAGRPVQIRHRLSLEPGGAARVPARRDQLLLGIAAELPRRGRSQLVKTGQAIPVFYDAGFDGKKFFVPDAVKGLPILTFHELYQKIKGTMPSGQFWDIYKAIIGADGIIQRMIVMPPGAPQPAVEALRAAIARVNVDKAYAEEAEKAFGFVPQWAGGSDTPKVAQTALTVRPEVRTFLADYMKNLPK